MQLNVRRFTRATISCSSPCSTAASVNTNTSIVAMSGAIIPEPLANPMIVTGTPSSTRAAAPFGKVSVVMIARAAFAAPSGRSPSRNRGIAATRRWTGSGSPITPVEATSTCPSGTPSAAAAAVTVACTASRPARPVNAFALPELARMANPPAAAPACSAASRSWHQSTGAERVAERVKSPATDAPGATSASITSSRPG